VNGVDRRREVWTSIGLITLFAVLAYAPRIWQLGFYRDDWYQLWAGRTLGWRSIITLFSIDRPVMGYLYAVVFRLLGAAPLNWQLYSLGLRWLGALGALWLLRRVWPGQALATTSAVLLMLVYPGFLQQPNADTFSNHLFGYSCAIVSLAAMIESVHRRGALRWLFILLAVAAALGSWLTYEYMIGLFALGYLFLARHLLSSSSRSARRRWLDVVAASIPFLIPLVLFLIYRTFFFEAGRGSVDVSSVLASYQPSPILELGRRAIEAGKDFVEATSLGWAVPTYDLFVSAAPALVLIAVALGGAAAFIYARFASWATGPAAQDTGESVSAYREFVLIGAFAVVAATVPVVLSGRDIRWSSAFDRYTLHATLGVGILITGLVFLGLRPPARRFAIAALLGLSVATHYANAASWAKFWDEQKTLWWQLTWRAPGIEPGTVLLATLPDFRFFEDYEAWGPANLIFASGREAPPIASQVVEELTAVKVRDGVSEVRSMRVLIGIPRDYTKTLVASWSSPQSCVHVLDREQLEASAADPSLILSLGTYSDIGRLDLSATQAIPPREIFGGEPTHDWCWFYQKASLARQQGDWERVVELGDQASASNLAPRDPIEWMPFLQGYVNLGRVDDAQRVAQAIRRDPLLAEAMCGRLSAVYFTDERSHSLGRRLLCDLP
jgi:hypothetical protein